MMETVDQSRIMGEPNILERLESALLDRYPDEGHPGRLLDLAGGSALLQDLDRSPAVAWHRVVQVAKSTGKLQDLIEVALREHPGDPLLGGVRAELLLHRTLPEHISDALSNLRKFLPRLRRSRHLSDQEIADLDEVIQQGTDFVSMAMTPDGDAEETPERRWNGLQSRYLRCTREVQLYRELLEDSRVNEPRSRRAGQRIPLADLAADRSTLLDVKEDLLEAVGDLCRQRVS